VARSKKTISQKIGDKIADVVDHALHPHGHEDSVQSGDDSTEEQSSGEAVQMDPNLTKFAKFNKGK
jgi:hypothetical protein